jgi:hypothetical protein
MQIRDILLITGHKYTISELNKYIQSKRDKIDKNLNKNCKILIIDDLIDDKDYQFKNNIAFLRGQCNCNISTKTDLENIADAGGYDIIICDNDSVGIKLGGIKSDGIWLLNQIQSQYPDKIYVLFSSYSASFRKIKRAKVHELWDKSELSRNSEENGEGGFSEKVQGVMNLYADPARRWEEIRNHLLSSGISIHTVARLESAYVKSIFRGKPELYTNLSRKVDISNDNNIDVHQFIRSAASIINTTISLLSIL